jgi:hypothetical protein
MTSIYQHAVIGFGIAGQLLLCELIQRGVQPNTIVILDPNWLGGALATEYSQVISNTPWWKTRQALTSYSPYSTKAIEDYDTKFQTNECMPVGDIAKACFQTASEASKGCDRITTTCLDTAFEDGTWRIRHTFGAICAKRIYLSYGAQEKKLELPLPLPQIPLQIALDRTLLSRYVSKSDTVLVIGCSHSGTICLEHLHVLGIQTIAVYNTPTPFQFARDGHYDGIKEGSERIADAILRGEYASTTQLLSYNDSFKMFKALQKATKCIQCIGFEPKTIGCQSLAYHHETARIDGPPNRFGYGIAFPGMSEQNGKWFPDVSVLAFQEQIRRTLPQILSQE